MIKKSTTLEKLEKCVRNGPGTYQITMLANAEELEGRAHEMTMAVIQPGCGSGYHTHDKNCEICFVLDGELEARDDDTIAIITAGDVTITKNGHGHCLLNKTDRPATIISLII